MQNKDPKAELLGKSLGTQRITLEIHRHTRRRQSRETIKNSPEVKLPVPKDASVQPKIVQLMPSIRKKA